MSGTRARRFRTDHAMVSVRSARIIHKLARLETSTSNFEIKHGRGGAAAMMPGLGGALCGSGLGLEIKIRLKLHLQQVGALPRVLLSPLSHLSPRC